MCRKYELIYVKINRTACIVTTTNLDLRMTPPTAPLSLRADHDRAVGHLSDGGWDIKDQLSSLTRHGSS
jgi:hypothetical protein